MTKGHMKRCSTNANQNDQYNEVSPHLVRMAIKNSTNSKCRRGYTEKGILLYCWWECKLAQPLRRKAWSFFKKLNIDLHYIPSNPTPRYMPWKNHNSKRYTHFGVHYSTVYNSQDVETTQASISRGTDEEDVIHITQWNTALSHKKNRTMPSEAAWTDPETAILREVRHRKTNIIRYCLHVESKKGCRWTYLQNASRVIDVENKLYRVTRG